MVSSRRRWLRALGSLTATGLAGCAGWGDADHTDSTTSSRSSATTGGPQAGTDASTGASTETTEGAGEDSPGDGEDGDEESGPLGEPDERTAHAVAYRDVPFRETRDGTLALDFFRPRDVDEPVPLVVHAHGGAWAFGSKGGGRFRRVPLSAGAAFASVGYRLSGTASFPHPVRDVVAAMAWCREHASALGVDPARVALTGESAGGHLSTLVALAPADARLRPVGVSAAAARASCVVSVSGVYDFRGRPFDGSWLVHQFLGCSPGDCERERAAASPVMHVDGDDVPILCYHGTADSIVPYAQAEEFVAAAERAGLPVTLVTGEGGEHVDPYAGSWGERYERRQRAFLRENLF